MKYLESVQYMSTITAIKLLPRFNESTTRSYKLQISYLNSGYGDPELYEFLIGNEGKREVPINLGDISYACIGNIGHCNDGFTIAFWIKVDKGYPNIPAQVSYGLFNTRNSF